MVREAAGVSQALAVWSLRFDLKHFGAHVEAHLENCLETTAKCPARALVTL